MACSGKFLTSISFSEHIENALYGTTPVIDRALTQLNEYFAGRRKAFDLPLKLFGTEFQQKVWIALSKIPYGVTVSYKDLAETVGNPKACRAIGMANNKNPLPIILPCHRVIGKNGSLTGYAGGLHIKKFLLDLEQQYK